MSDIASIISVYNMDGITNETRAKVIIRLGQAINNAVGMNLTEELVYELLNTIEARAMDNRVIKDFYSHYDAMFTRPTDEGSKNG